MTVPTIPAPCFWATAVCLFLAACSSRTTDLSPTPVGCYHFDRPVSYSAAGALEAADSAWYVLEFLPDGRVDRPRFPASRRETFARRSRWRVAGDTLHVHVFDGLTGWDLALQAQDRHYRGMGTYLSDAIALGRPPFEAPFAAKAGPCVAAP